MKFSRLFPIGLKVVITLLCLAVLPAARATNTTNAPSSGAKTNSAPEETPIPLSVFDLSVKPTRDPFFPLSNRQPVPALATNAPAISASTFTLKGLSGSFSHPLALVNNRTVAPGEDAEVTTPTGKFRIHCVEIKPPSVFLRISSQSDLIEISLRKTAQ
ncbi:MAG TPA: hypothetical protein VG754_09820 [Verrucomicrobiae bacterium]|jgi:hypothetical protein|nr:hypothetical protein [Verrucomicrobiae bacterium]